MTGEPCPPQDQEIEIEALGVEVSCQPIELYKVLKIANAVSGGGEAKHAISEGYVSVNGEVDTRKRAKIYDGDLIEFNQEFYLVICDTPVAEPVLSGTAKPVRAQKQHAAPDLPTKPSRKAKSKAVNSAQSTTNNPSKAKAKQDKSKPSAGRGAIRLF
ncbi:MAG: RNA-binding S4 domain-containing protein [Vibrio sp.]